MIFTNSVDSAKRNTVKRTNTVNSTTNAYITQAEHDRQIAEYDNGTLVVSHDLLLGERL